MRNIKHQKILIFSFFIYVFFNSVTSYAQPLKISGYVDAYYAYYTDSVGTNNYQKFPVISPKSNQFGLNIFQITAQYTGEKIRAVGTLHYGDIASSAWSPVFNMVQEANAGVRIAKNLWIDAGFFKTHIGTEALLPKDNIASSLSLITFYEPWWQAGVKMTLTPTDNLTICLHALNGYNTFVDNNEAKSFGMALTYLLGDKGNIGYYNLVGDETPRGTPGGSHLRFLNNIVFNYQFTDKFRVNIGADHINQQHSAIHDSSKSANVFSGIVTAKIQATPKFAVYARGEAFSDEDGFLTGVMTDVKGHNTGFMCTGATLGFEIRPRENAYVRFEGRDLMMQKSQKIFRTIGSNTNNRFEFLINMGISF